MVFEDETSDDTSSLSYMHSTSSMDGLNQVPFSVEDPDYHGLELETMSVCEKHGKASERLVAFEGTDTGRRFLACAEPNLKLKHITDKQLLTEAKMNLELKNAELTKSEEKLTQDKLELKFQVADLLKGKEKHGEEKGQLELQITELIKAEEKLKEKIKGIQAILEK
ncbi:hypothetical protein VPH35_126204 [Triticum aestivum]